MSQPDQDMSSRPVPTPTAASYPADHLLSARAAALWFDEQAVAEATRLWIEDYEPWLYFLDLSQLDDLTHRVATLRRRDASDVASGILAELICPPLFFSEDKDLASFGLLPPRAWTMGAVAYRDSSKSDGIGLTVSAMATVLLTLCLQGSIALIPHAVILVKRIPWWLQLAAGAGAAIALAHPTSRAWLTSRWSPVIARILARVREESLRLGQEWAQLLHAAEAAEAWLTTVAREETPVQTELEAMMRVLVTTPTEHPLTPTELVHQMIAMGYDPPCEHPEITVGRLLHHYDRLFLQPVARHWCLRRV